MHRPIKGMHSFTPGSKQSEVIDIEGVTYSMLWYTGIIQLYQIH